MNRRSTSLLMTGALLLSAQPAWARNPAYEAAESPQYSRKAGGMLGRGLLNVVTCPVDLITNIVNETKHGPPLVGTLVGIGKGAGCTILRAGSGVVDVATFWVPTFNGFPVSESYDNCLATGETSAESSTWGPSSTVTPSYETAPAATEATPAPQKKYYKK